MGTYPSEISCKLSQYYGNPNNQFWDLVGYALDVDLRKLDYDSRIETLKKHKIGLWDALKDCRREGSLDKNIREEEFNDFSQLNNVKRIICNGKKAREYVDNCKVPDNVEIVLVPSSSPERAMKLSVKSEQWKEAISATIK